MTVPATKKPASFSALSTFAVVAEELSFVRAAQRLGVTPTAVSKVIRQLEDELSVRLFNRTTRSVSLTEAGAELVSGVQPALNLLDDSLRRAMAANGPPRGELRINSSHVAFTSLLEPHLPAFLAAYPEVGVEVAVDNELSDIVAQGFDAGIRLGHTLQKDMVAFPLGPRQHRIVVGSSGYLEGVSPPQVPEDLIAHNCIRQRLSTQGRMHDWVFEKSGKTLRIDVGGQLIVDEMRAALNAAVAGVGLAFVFRQFASHELESGKLTVLLEPFCPPGEAFYLYYPQGKQMPGKLRAFIDFIKARNRVPAG